MITSDLYPLRHISIRVPWHDDVWRGTVCKAPRFNGACLKLPRIAESRNDAAEEAVAGRSIEELQPEQLPCCVGERATFMAEFEFTLSKNHPYAKSSPTTHGHFDATPLRHPPYSAAAVPFLWMRRENMEEFARHYDLPIEVTAEPELSFKTGWVQAKQNQQALLDCFFGHIRPAESLCIFYAKQVPFVEETGRVIIGIGRVKHVGEAIEYRYKAPGPLKCVLGEGLGVSPKY